MKNHTKHTILLTGVPGVGKTSLAEKIVSKYDIKLVNFGDVLFNLIKEKGIKDIEHIDQIRTKLEPEAYHDLQLEAATKINFENKANTLISSHLTIDTPFGFIPGFPDTVVEILRPCLTILVEAPTEEIKERRLADKSDRVRGQRLEQLIDFHQDLNRSMAASFSYHTGNFILPVTNKQGELEDTFDQLTPVLDQHLMSE